MQERSTTSHHILRPGSLGISVLIHLVLITVLISYIRLAASPGTRNGNSNDQTVGIVFTKDQGYASPDETLVAAQQNEQEPEQPPADSAPLDRSVESLLPDLDTIGMTSSSNLSATDSANGDPGAALLPHDGSSSGGSTGDGQTVGFASLRGRGKKFVYVLDHSESMKWAKGYAMSHAVSEAKKSIMSLDPVQGAKKFQIVVYNHESQVWGREALLDTSLANRQKACQFLDTLFPEGGTDPQTALERAVSLRPDVIFFLTDADEEISSSSLARIHQTAQNAHVRQIHVLEFRRRGAQEQKSFQKLAEENGGSHQLQILPE